MRKQKNVPYAKTIRLICFEYSVKKVKIGFFVAKRARKWKNQPTPTTVMAVRGKVKLSPSPSL